MSANYKTFAPIYCKLLRTYFGLSIRDLAMRSSLSKTTICSFENGEQAHSSTVKALLMTFKNMGLVGIERVNNRGVTRYTFEVRVNDAAEDSRVLQSRKVR